LASFPASGYTSNETWSITATLSGTITAGTVSGGNLTSGSGWTGINGFGSINLLPGNVNVNVYASNGTTTNNMFGGTGTSPPLGGMNYTNTTPPSVAALTGSSLSGTTTVTITFTINANTVYTPSSPSSIVLTLK
jgi:hypothetical protein